MVKRTSAIKKNKIVQVLMVEARTSDDFTEKLNNKLYELCNTGHYINNVEYQKVEHQPMDSELDDLGPQYVDYYNYSALIVYFKK